MVERIHRPDLLHTMIGGDEGGRELSSCQDRHRQLATTMPPLSSVPASMLLLIKQNTLGEMGKHNDLGDMPWLLDVVDGSNGPGRITMKQRRQCRTCSRPDTFDEKQEQDGCGCDDDHDDLIVPLKDNITTSTTTTTTTTTTATAASTSMPSLTKHFDGMFMSTTKASPCVTSSFSASTTGTMRNEEWSVVAEDTRQQGGSTTSNKRRRLLYQQMVRSPQSRSLPDLFLDAHVSSSSSSSRTRKSLLL
jgi:hypothetical protein